MIDADPAQRPSLEAVLLSSSLDDAEASYTEAAVTDLVNAATAYKQKVGRTSSRLATSTNRARAKVADQAALARKLAPLQAELDRRIAAIEAINARVGGEPLLAPTGQASAACR